MCKKNSIGNLPLRERENRFNFEKDALLDKMKGKSPQEISDAIRELADKWRV